jgi:sugar phosphate isomerase/epimerase
VIDVRRWGLPFRVGTTSYIVPDDLLPNAEFLAPQVQDMQLVLFDVPLGPSNLPAPEVVAALAALGRGRDLTYTVHLIHDLRLYDEDSTPSLALANAQEVIDLTLPLAPLAWVCHLDGRSVRHLHPGAPDLSPHESTQWANWVTVTAAALEQVCAWAGSGNRVAVENLEGYVPDFVVPVVARTPVGRCLDVGHLWLDGVDPLPHLDAALPRLRVLHLHGVDPQRRTDHCSLAYADPGQLDAVLGRLLAAGYDGVVCLEVFEEEDFHSSLAAWAAAVSRVRGERTAAWTGV